MPEMSRALNPKPTLPAANADPGARSITLDATSPSSNRLVGFIAHLTWIAGPVSQWAPWTPCPLVATALTSEPKLQTHRREVKRRPLAAVRACHELAQALVILVAGGTALEVCAQPGQAGVGVLAGQLEIHVLVEALEALLASDLGAGRSEQAGDQVSVGVVCAHVPPPVWSCSG